MHLYSGILLKLLPSMKLMVYTSIRPCMSLLSLSLSFTLSSSLSLPFLYCIFSLLISLSLFLFSNGSSILVPGSEILTSQGYKTEWLWYDQIGLGGLALLFLTLTYITLRLIKKEK